METIIKETDKYVLTESGQNYSGISKYKKFLCIGGPFDGQFKASVQLNEESYFRFANSNYSRHGFRDFRNVFIHINSLEEK
jgi:hypothetical protein